MADTIASPAASAAASSQSPAHLATWGPPRTGIASLPLSGGVFFLGFGLLLGFLLGAAIGKEWVAMPATYGGFGAALAYWWYFAHKARFSFWRSIGKPMERAHVVPLCLACIALTGVRLGWFSALSTWGTLPEVVIAKPGSAQAYLFCLIIVGLDPIVEEILFRGLLFWQLSRWIQPIGAAAVSSLLFGAFHPDPVGSTCMALIVTGLYARTQTLWVPMVAHGLLNGLAILLGSDSVWSYIMAHTEIVLWLQLLFVPWFVWLCIQSARALRGFSFPESNP